MALHHWCLQEIEDSVFRKGKNTKFKDRAPREKETRVKGKRARV
jgi:hypothetical protein